MVHDLQLQDLYAGAFRHAIDEKNRITIRSQWRRREGEEKGEDFIMLPGPKLQYLLIMRPDEFVQMTANAENSSTVTPSEARKFLRQAHARAQLGSSDKQGRLVLPPEMCSLLNLKGEVMLVGGRGRFEVWNLQKWQDAYEQETDTFDRVSDAIGL
jgi:transcriptional regulator MraZ